MILMEKLFKWFKVQMIPELMTLMDQLFLVNQTHVVYNLLLCYTFP